MLVQSDFNKALPVCMHFPIIFHTAVKLTVYTFNEGVYHQFQFESGRLTTAQQVLTRVREALGVPEEIEHVFSIWLTSKHLRKSEE